MSSSRPNDDPELQVPHPPQLDRSDLVARARTFLLSPQIVHQDASAKRKFLAEKGLHETEIDALLKDIPPSTALIPPRNYPQPAPSNLPTLLLGLVRILSWIAGGSAALLFIYWRFFLPRIARTYRARQSLRSHYGALLQKFTSSLAAFKESQAESYSVLPRAEPHKEPEQYTTCQTVDEVLKVFDGEASAYEKLPPVPLLRVAVADLKQGRGAETASPTEELFSYLEATIPWLTSESGRVYEQTLWETLSTCPLFNRTLVPSSGERTNETTITTRWSYQPPTPREPSQLQKSIVQLLSSLPKPKTETQDTKYHHTMQALSNLTGYISTQAYLPYKTVSGLGGLMGSSSLLSPAEEELRREIRALKGLVLNRRSFMTSLPRAPFTAVQQDTLK